MENFVFKVKSLREELIDRAKENNHFFGIISRNGSGYFIRELLSDVILPLKFIEYEIPPGNDEFSKNFYFRLINKDDILKMAAELIEKRFIGINEDRHYHLHQGTVFDGEVVNIGKSYISVFIPFFSEHAMIETTNCQSALKKRYNAIRVGERLRVKLIRLAAKTMFVKIDGFAFWRAQKMPNQKRH
jgi:hypothetical protein